MLMWRTASDHVTIKHSVPSVYCLPNNCLRKPLMPLSMTATVNWLVDVLVLLQGKASADHTTLLLNCYTKLKDVDKLDQFLRGSGAADTTPSLNFDVETAVKVFSHSSSHLFIHSLILSSIDSLRVYVAQWSSMFSLE